PRPRFAPLARSFSIKSWSSVIDVVRERRSIFPEPERLMSSPRSRRSNSLTWASTCLRSVFLPTGFFIECFLLSTHGPTADRAQSVASPRESQRQPPSRGVLAEGESMRLAVDRLDDAAGEVEVAADQRLDVSRLDALFPILGEVSAVPIALLVLARPPGLR